MKQFRVSDFNNLSKDEIEKALEEGFDLNTFKRSVIGVMHLTPLIHSVTYNRLSVFQLLIKYGADPNRTDDFKDTILHYASVYNQVYYLNFILRYGCVVDSFNNNGYTPLREAIYYKGYKCIIPLLDAGAKISNVKNVIIPDDVIILVQKRNQLKGRIVLFLALSKKTKAIHKDLLTTISKMIWELRDTEKEEKKQSKKKFKK